MRLGEAEEAELPGELLLHPRARLLVGRVPLVHRQHHRAAALEHVARDVRVLLGDAGRGVEQQDGDVRRLDRLQRLDDGEEFDRLAGLAAPAQARGVDQRVAPAAALERHLDRVARGAGLVEGDDALLAHQRVDQRRLADVGAADDGDAGMASFFLLALGFLGKFFQHQVHQLAHAFAVGGGNGGGRAEAELVELGDRDVGLHALGLVDGEIHRGLQFAELLRDIPVRRESGRRGRRPRTRSRRPPPSPARPGAPSRRRCPAASAARSRRCRWR